MQSRDLFRKIQMLSHTITARDLKLYLVILHLLGRTERTEQNLLTNQFGSLKDPKEERHHDRNRI